MNMIESFISDSNDIIDKRILREEYRNYDLVARYWEYGYMGKIWKHRKAVDEIDASDTQGLDDLMKAMRKQVDGLISARSKARKNKAPSQAELSEVFMTLSDKFTVLEKLLLKVHAEEENGEVEISKLQRVLNLTSADSILELYSRIGQKINDETGYLPKPVKGQNVNLNLVVESKPRSQVLKLHEPIQILVQSLGW